MAAYVVPDAFYHAKPFDNKTMHYLMIRLLGDICPNIVLLYDRRMEEEFQDKGSPFHAKNTIMLIDMIDRSIKDIKMTILPHESRQIE